MNSRFVVVVFFSNFQARFREKTTNFQEVVYFSSRRLCHIIESVQSRIEMLKKGLIFKKKSKKREREKERKQTINRGRILKKTKKKKYFF